MRLELSVGRSDDSLVAGRGAAERETDRQTDRQATETETDCRETDRDTMKE